MIRLTAFSWAGFTNDHSSDTTKARAPRSTSVRTCSRTWSSSSGRITSPRASIRSLTPTISRRGTIGFGLFWSGSARRSSSRVPSIHCAPLPIRVASSWPWVVISATRGPERSSSRFIATVVRVADGLDLADEVVED